MGNNGDRVPLDSMATFLSGGTPSKSNSAFWGGDIPWVSAKDMKAPVIDDSEDHISSAGLQAGSRLAPKGSTLVLTRGMTLLRDVPTCAARREVAFNQDIKAVVPRDGIDPRFLNLSIRAAKTELLGMIELAGHGTGRLPTDRLKALLLRRPDITEQRAIADILGSLDDKIELNRRMNETLEATARAIFKSWFVDFDPVRAKMEGRKPAGMSDEVAALFPDSFQDSPLGKIPKGWEAKSLGDLLELAYGKALKADDRNDGSIPVYGSNGQVGWHDERLVAGPGIVVGRKGNPGITTWVQTDFFPIDTTFYVVPKATRRRLAFLFYVLQTHDLASLGADSAVPGLNRNLAYMSGQVLPPTPLLAQFDHFATALSQRAHHANDEGRALAGLRDTLLPKLISGELRVRDVEKVAEAAA